MTGVSSPRSASGQVIVFAGGESPPAALLDDLDRTAFVVAADSGLDRALALGFHVDVVVGDLDSVSETALRAASEAGVAVERHPTEKDATDLELALASARAHGARHVTVVGGGGGRHDHLLANTLVLASPEFADLELVALVGTARVTVVRERAQLVGSPGSICSLLPVGGVARGVRTRGLRYPLHDEDLDPGTTRGVSNELTEPTATVSVRDGVLLAVQPRALEE